MRSQISAVVLACVSFSAYAAENYWVTSDTLERRTCPAATCGVVGQLLFREKASVLEVKNGWARITTYYDASCVADRSEYVDTGNAACIAENGINDGKFAEWVSLKALSKTRPADPGADATGVAALISGSDDYRHHKDAFVKAAQSLLEQKKCTENDFKESGGWYKSTNYRNQPVYFIYCGGFHKNNKIHLDVSNGRIFK
jgi:hypothetical protein